METHAAHTIQLVPHPTVVCRADHPVSRISIFSGSCFNERVVEYFSCFCAMLIVAIIAEDVFVVVVFLVARIVVLVVVI